MHPDRDISKMVMTMGEAVMVASLAGATVLLLALLVTLVV